MERLLRHAEEALTILSKELDKSKDLIFSQELKDKNRLKKDHYKILEASAQFIASVNRNCGQYLSDVMEIVKKAQESKKLDRDCEAAHALQYVADKYAKEFKQCTNYVKNVNTTLRKLKRVYS